MIGGRRRRGRRRSWAQRARAMLCACSPAANIGLISLVTVRRVVFRCGGAQIDVVPRAFLGRVVNDLVGIGNGVEQLEEDWRQLVDPGASSRKQSSDVTSQRGEHGCGKQAYIAIHSLQRAICAFKTPSQDRGSSLCPTRLRRNRLKSEIMSKQTALQTPPWRLVSRQPQPQRRPELLLASTL